MGSAASVVDLDSTTGGTGLSECGIGSAMRQAASPGGVSLLLVYVATRTRASPVRYCFWNRMDEHVVHVFDEGGRQGLEPSRGKLEADEGRREAAVGKTDRRRPHSDRRESGKARGDHSG